MSSKHNQISRRQFLTHSTQTAAGILASTALGSCTFMQSTKTHKPGSKMKFGLVTYMWAHDWPLPTLIHNCEKAKVLAVELRTTHAHGVEPDLNAQQRKEVKKRFADSPVTLAGLGSDERFDNPDTEKLAKAIATTKEFIKLSYEVGASGVKVKPNSFRQGVPHEKTIEQIGTSLNTVAKFAADYNQQVRLEVHGKCSELPTIKAIMDIADHPNAAICWNSNQTDLKGKGLEYNFNLVKHRFGATTHVRELNSTEYPYQQLINLFANMDYNGWILLETRTKTKDRVQALIEQRKLFEQMLANAQTQV